MKKLAVAAFADLVPLTPMYALVANVDLVMIRLPDKDQVSVLYGRCLHRGALMSDGHIEGKNLVCGLHDWDYRYDTGVRYRLESQVYRLRNSHQTVALN